MPNARPVPTVRRRRLGEALRRYRNTTGLSLDAASAELGWLGPKLSQIETANGHIRPADVAPLLKVYGVTDPDVVNALEGLAKDARKQRWWQTDSRMVAQAYADCISLESDAESLHVWSPLLVPGLLQTAGYARETRKRQRNHPYSGRGCCSVRGTHGAAGGTHPARWPYEVLGRSP
ncbi:Scr1 family TA system antitoxin-like transcriptional regulator [Streptomyces castrisilvae]|uniref:Scr1 family TA system antitoxin-like transcriptional regulator n=1 Tax=Streptomyces castrisilvae TaxID=3033811 RepID=UPI003531808A